MPAASLGRRGGTKEVPQESAKQAACKASRRFMIYVHSKVLARLLGVWLPYTCHSVTAMPLARQLDWLLVGDGRGTAAGASPRAV